MRKLQHKGDWTNCLCGHVARAAAPGRHALALLFLQLHLSNWARIRPLILSSTEEVYRLSWQSSGWDFLLLLQGARVRSLVRELRSSSSSKEIRITLFVKCGYTTNEITGWNHWFSGYALGQTLGDSEGQGGLACCSPRSHKESDTNWTTTQAMIHSATSSMVSLRSWTAASFLPQCNHGIPLA